MKNPLLLLKKITPMLALAAMMLAPVWGWGQVTIASQDFETTPATPTITFTNTNGAFYTGSSVSGDRPASSPFYSEGARAFGCNATSTATYTAILNFANQTGLSSYISKYFEFRLAAWSIGSTTNGVDGTDIVTVEVSIDGGTNWSSELRVLGNSNAFWHYSTGTGIAAVTFDGNNIPTDFTPASGGNRTTDGYSTVRVNLPDAGTQARLRITMVNNAASERWTIDALKLIGVVATSPTKLAITSITPTSPTAGSGFNVTVQAQDASNTPSNVAANTSFDLTTNGNAGVIGGILSGTINAGSNSVTVSGVTLSTSGTLVSLTATRTIGDNLTAGTSSTFTVLPAASQLAFVGVPTSGVINTNLTSFTVEARRPDNSVDNTYTGNVTISKASGSGVLSGTLTKACLAGVATFNDIKFDAADTYTISSSSGALTGATSGSIVITLAVPSPPTSLTFGSVTYNSFNSSFTAPGVAPTGYIVLRRTGSAVTGTPVAGIAYTQGQTNIGSGVNEVIYVAASVWSIYAQTGLADNTAYHYAVYSYNGTGTSTVYSSTALTGNQTTASIPAPNATAASNITSSSFTANWDAVPGATAYKIDIYTETSGGNTTDLFISEYVEGSSNNKYIEIFNGTGSGVDLTNYRVYLFANGAIDGSPTNTENLTGTLPNGSTLVLKNLAAAIYSGTASVSTTCNFNGDDAIGLYKVSTSTYADIFGRIGSDPGTQWTSTSNSTLDQTLRRKSTVSGGVTNNPSGTGPTAFTTLETEWTQYAIDNVADIGSHTFSGGTVQTFIVTDGNAATNSYSISSLSPNTAYKYRVRATGVNGTSGNSNVIDVTTNQSPATATFTGSVSSAWELPENWNPDLPGAITNVTIPANKTAVVNSNDYECNDLTIAPLGGLTINSGKDLLANGNFIIQSDATGTGSLIDNGTFLANTTTVQRYLVKYNAVGDRMFHFISSPVASQAIQTEFVSTPIADFTDFYSFNEPTNYWINSRANDNSWNSSFESTFTVGKGYLVAYPDIVTKNFTGTLNSAQEVLTCTNTTTPGGNGWNLLGNPFPSAIDWTLVTKGAGMDVALYYYDNATENYVYYINIDGVTIGSGSQYVPAMQGFMAHASTNGATLTIPVAAKTHSGQNVFYKSTNAVPGSLSLKVMANGYDDEAFIYFNQGATAAFDGSFDAYKLRSYSDQVPMIFTKGSDNSELAINGLPELDGSTVIPVYFEASTEGAHTLTANLEGLPNAIVYLEDLKLNNTQNFTANPVYSFTASSGDNANRFKLTFGSVGIDNPTATDAVLVYAHNGLVYLNGAPANATINILDITGRVVQQSKTNGSSLTTLNVSNLPHGVYVVNIISGKQLLSRKIIL